jgi:hypothetical protein
VGLEPIITENYRMAGYGAVELKRMKPTKRPRKLLVCDANSVTHVFMPDPAPAAKEGEVQKPSYDISGDQISGAMATRLRKARLTRRHHTNQKGCSSLTQPVIDAAYVTPEGVWRLNEYGRSLVPEFVALYCRTEDRAGKRHKFGVYDNCACATQP